MAIYISQLTWSVWVQLISAMFAAIAAIFWLLSGLAGAPYRPGMDYNLYAPEFMRFYAGFKK